MNQPQMKVPFARVPLALAQDRAVSDAAFRMYAIIAAWTPNKKDGLRYIHCAALAAALDIQDRHVKRLTAQLCAAGWLLKSGDGGCNRPARYQPLQHKTRSSEDRVLDENHVITGHGLVENHVITGHGQSVDTLSLYKPSVDEVDSDARARANAPAADASASSDKYRFPLPHDFRPPQAWIDAGRQARAAAGRPPLSPLQTDALIAKFVGKKTQQGKPMDWTRWQLAFIEWFVRENHNPKKTLGRKESVTPQTATPLQTAVEAQPAAEMPTAIPTATPLQTAAATEPAVEMPTATPTAAPPPSAPENESTALAAATAHAAFIEAAKIMGQKMAMPIDRGYQPQHPGATVSPSPSPAKIWVPKKRADFAARAAALGINLPKNCPVAGNKPEVSGSAVAAPS